jgi:hypothetical protein
MSFSETFKNAVTLISLMPRFVPLPTAKTKAVMESQGWEFSIGHRYGPGGASCYTYSIKKPSGEYTSCFDKEYISASRDAFRSRFTPEAKP